MNLFSLFRCILLLLCLTGSGSIAAAKYLTVNEAPDKIPETEEEKSIWAIGRAHQEKVRETGEVINDVELEAYLAGVATRMFGDMLEFIGLEVEVLIFRDPTVNAWVYPDGTIAVQTGLLAAMENEAQLAAILGHEISHFLNRHAYIQIKSKQKQKGFGNVLGVLATATVAAKTGKLDTSLMGVGQVWTDLVTSGYSRDLETKADAQGLELLAAAGYNPNQALPAFEAMRIKDDDEVNIAKMWSSHPDIDTRLKNLRKRIKKMKSPPDFVPAPEPYVKAVGSAILVDAQLNTQRRRFDLALQMMNRYIEILPEQVVGRYLLGEIHRKKTPEGPDYEPRVSAYNAAIAMDEQYAPAYRELGMAYRQQHQVEAAIGAFEKYVALAPDAVDTPIIRWYLDDLKDNGAP